MEGLPNEMLTSISKNLPQSDLVRVTETCKHLSAVADDLIEHLYIGKKNDSSTPQRKHYTKATVTSYEADKHHKIFESVGSQLTTLKFSQCSMNLIDITKILQCTPNIKFLTFDYVRLDDNEINGATLSPLVDVTLIMNESDPKIFAALQKSSLVKVVVALYGDVPYSNFAEFVKVLMDQEKLTSLSISGAYETNLFLIQMAKAKYQLKEFTIDNCDLEEWAELEAYLSQHVTTLEKLAIKNVRWDPSTTLNRCVTLKTLNCHRIDMQLLEVLASVEELSMEPTVMLHRFPNVKKLFVSRCSTESFRTISRSMTKLLDAEVRFGGVAGFEVPSLRKLKLSSLDIAIDPNFFVIHKLIEDLWFECVFNITDDLLESITANLTHLKVLRIRGDNHLTARAFSIIKDNCKSLKVFEMAKWDQKFSKDDWNCLYEINGLEVYRENFD